MREQDKPESIHPPAPFCELPPIEGERRKEQDRRSMERQGKYDRRRNRCVHCLHFQEDSIAGKGMCLFHHVEMTAYSFACPNFDSLPAGESRKL